MLTLLDEVLHLLPGVGELPVIDDVALAVGQGGERGMVSVRV